MAVLWNGKYSPWSLRCRWALKLLKFDFIVVPDVSVFLRVWRLRLMFWRWHVNVPVLIDGKTCIMGGKEIVEYAQSRDAGAPKLLRDGVEEWIGIADDIMENERARGLDLVLNDDEALKAAVPRAQRWLFKLGFLGFALIRGRVKAMARKYPQKYNEQQMKMALSKIRSGIQASSSGYLVGDTLSFADIACVTAIETVRGTPGKHVIRFFPPHEGLDYPLNDLLAWRGTIHEQHWVEGI